jgi:hypothetical protein
MVQRAARRAYSALVGGAETVYQLEPDAVWLDETIGEFNLALARGEGDLADRIDGWVESIFVTSEDARFEDVHTWATCFYEFRRNRNALDPKHRIHAETINWLLDEIARMAEEVSRHDEAICNAESLRPQLSAWDKKLHDQHWAEGVTTIFDIAHQTIVVQQFRILWAKLVERFSEDEMTTLRACVADCAMQRALPPLRCPFPL